MAKRPGGAMVQGAGPTQSEMFPILTKWGELNSKSQLGPMIVTIVAVMLMFTFSDNAEPLIVRTGHPQYWIYTSPFILIVATYLTMLSLYFIYRLVGKKFSLVPLFGCSVFTIVFLWLFQTQGSFSFMYEFFHGVLAGGEIKEKDQFATMFYKHFVGTGFFEETVKALPLLLILFCGKFLSPGLRQKFKITEPLDGILLGAAAGGGFAWMETVGQYVSGNLVDAWMGYALNLKFGTHIPIYKNADLAWELIQKGFHQMGTAPGVQLLIPRMLGNAFGHMAYSGLFGYFIGLSVMKPQRRWLILGLGLVSASIPHALWDSVGIFDSDLIQMSVGLLSYAVLGAAVLKAREISPNRVMLQPSVVFGNMGSGQAYSPAQPASPSPAYSPVTPAAEAVVSMHPVQTHAAPLVHTPPPPQMMPQPNVLPPAPPTLPPGTLSLRIGPRYLVIVAGLRVLEHQAPGLRPLNPGGPVAEVTRNPQDPTILGLTNLSISPWQVTSPSGTRREIQSGQSFKLAIGTKIDFGGIAGGIDGEVR